MTGMISPSWGPIYVHITVHGHNQDVCMYMICGKAWPNLRWMVKCTPVEVFYWPTTPLIGLSYDHPYPSGSQHLVTRQWPMNYNGMRYILLHDARPSGMHTWTLHMDSWYLALSPATSNILYAENGPLPIFLCVKSGVAWGRGYLALLLPNLVWLSSLTPLWGAVGRPLLHLPHSHFCLLVQVQLCNWVSSLMSSNVQDCLVREKVIFIKLWNVHH